MSDPSGISSIGQNAASTQGKGQVVQIVSLPEGLEQNARAIRIEGEVVQQNKDGTIRLSTPQGDIDIAVRGRQPQQGQHIEIDIPPGSPPRQATIRQAPAQMQPQTPPSQTAPPPVTDIVTTQPPLPQTPVTRPADSVNVPPPRTDGTPPPLSPQPQIPTTQPKPAQPQQQAPVDFYQPSPEIIAAKTQTKTPQASLPLKTGQTVALIPAAEGIDTVQDGMIKTSGDITQAKPTNLVTTLLQSVKSAIPAALIPQKSLIPSGMGQQAQSSAPMNGMTQPIAAGMPPSPLMQTVPALMAKIVSIALPQNDSDAPLFPQPATAKPEGAGMIQPVTVSVKSLTQQGHALLSIPMDEAGTTKNFLIQIPNTAGHADNIPVGTKITLTPQLAANTGQTATIIQTPQLQGISVNPPAQGQQQITPAIPGQIQAPSSGMPGLTQPALNLPPVATLPPAWRPLLPLMQAATLWPAMDDLFQAFYQATPQAAQILGRIVPSPAQAASFGPALMLFAAAMKSGDLQGWLGDKKFDMLQKLGKTQLATRLSGETSSLASNTDASATEWKSLPIPLLWQNEISKVMFHVRKEPSEDGRDAKDSDQTRFVMDLSLTRMGDVQLDGMIRGKQVDLIVRTQTPISFHMQDAMRTAYSKALDGTDIYGEIGFQSNIKEWAHILKREDVLTDSA